MYRHLLRMSRHITRGQGQDVIAESLRRPLGHRRLRGRWNNVTAQHERVSCACLSVVPGHLDI